MWTTDRPCRRPAHAVPDCWPDTNPHRAAAPGEVYLSWRSRFFLPPLPRTLSGLLVSNAKDFLRPTLNPGRPCWSTAQPAALGVLQSLSLWPWAPLPLGAVRLGSLRELFTGEHHVFASPNAFGVLSLGEQVLRKSERLFLFSGSRLGSLLDTSALPFKWLFYFQFHWFLR